MLKFNNKKSKSMCWKFCWMRPKLTTKTPERRHLTFLLLILNEWLAFKVKEQREFHIKHDKTKYKRCYQYRASAFFFRKVRSSRPEVFYKSMFCKIKMTKFLYIVNKRVRLKCFPVNFGLFCKKSPGNSFWSVDWPLSSKKQTETVINS